MSRVEDLFERFRSQGDADALGRVFDELGPRMQRIARHLAPDRAAAEDLVQATFLTAIEKRDTFNASRALEPWLTGILIQHASLARRARARFVDPARLDSRASEDPLDVAGAREMSEALTVALSKLKPSDREVLLPLLLDGRRAIEIARELGRRPDTVNMRIHRGLARLRRLLPASFAFALWTRSSHARGLGAVKAEVMRQAHVQLGVAGGAGASIAVTTWGVVMTTKQMGLAAASLAVSLAVGGYLLVPSIRGKSARSAPWSSATLEPAVLDGASHSPALTVTKAPTDSPSRSEVPLSTPPDAKKHVELEILRSNHAPAAGALVAVMDSSHTLASAKTDEKGLCTLESKEGTADVYVRDDARLPFHTLIVLEPEERQAIDLPDGEELAGRLTMSNGDSFPDMELKLSTNTAPDGFAQADMLVFKALELTRYDSKQILARTRPLANGTFRFRALPTAWSGTLSMPKELVFVVAGKPTESSETVFTAAASGLDFTIAFRPRIIGRLIDSATRAPLADAIVECTLEWTDGGGMSTGFRTRADGRFTLPLDYRTNVVMLEFNRIQSGSGALAHVASPFKWTGPCEPRDLGDVECTTPPSRRIEFHVVDPRGLPLSGAHARIRDFELVTTDAHGIGEFPAVPFDSSEMRIAAPGHVIISVPLTAQTVSPLEVVLAPTNKLTITLPPEAAGRKGLSVSLVSRPLLFGGSSRIYDTVLRVEMVGHCSSADGDRGTKEGSVNFTFNSEGRLEIEDIRTGVPFRVVLRGSTTPIPSLEAVPLAEVKIDSIGPQEQRVVAFTMHDLESQKLRRTRGRAVDEDGQPILEAGIGTCFACDSKYALSGLDGSFSLDIGKDSTDVEVSKRGYVSFRVHDLNLVDDKPLEALLVRGRDLRVDVVDTRGRPIEAVRISADVPGFGSPVIEPVSTGVFTLCDLPPGNAQIVVRVAGKSYESSSDTRAGTARITLPEHGRLELSWTFHGTKDASKSYRIALRPVGSDKVAQTEWLPWPDRVTKHTFESVLPGEYTIGFEMGTAADEDGLDPDYSASHPPEHGTIVGGETKTVELHP